MEIYLSFFCHFILFKFAKCIGSMSIIVASYRGNKSRKFNNAGEFHMSILDNKKLAHTQCMC
jgi:hypothetical protein